jgi:ubiquinone/menaquinone biosynthesis C-methylase UbiE
MRLVETVKNNSFIFDSLSEKDKEAERLEIRSKVRLTSLVPTLVSIGLTSDMKVLEVGVGTGTRAIELAKFLKNGSLVGIDVSNDLLKKTRQNLISSGLKNTSLTVADITSKSSLQGLGTFDFIHVRLLIQHLKKPVYALKNLNYLLKPGGKIFLEDTDRDWVNVVPSNKSWDKLYEKVKKGQKLRGGDPNCGRKLGFHLTQAGFTDVKVSLVPVYGENEQVEEWLNNYVPSFFIHLNEKDRTLGLKIVNEMKRYCSANPMFFFQTWFQAYGKKSYARKGVAR